jgi:hypothetical protein
MEDLFPFLSKGIIAPPHLPKSPKTANSFSSSKDYRHHGLKNTLVLSYFCGIEQTPFRTLNEIPGNLLKFLDHSS